MTEKMEHSNKSLDIVWSIKKIPLFFRAEGSNIIYASVSKWSANGLKVLDT